MNLTLLKYKKELEQDGNLKTSIFNNQVKKFNSIIVNVSHIHSKVTKGRAGNPNYSSVQESKNRSKEITRLLRTFNTILATSSNNYKIERENLNFFFETFSGIESLKYLRSIKFTSERQAIQIKTKYIKQFKEIEKLVHKIKISMPYVDYMKFYRNYQESLVKLKQYNTSSIGTQLNLKFNENTRSSN